ncbi:hypothetical protein Leryth_024185 [Lithospermum erythrorhizon]|nr:hypothetical protein Leryth_024185 [Lithospermum erythrorhizon]
MTKNIVFKLNIDSAEDQQKAMKLVVSKVQGVEFIAFDMKEKKLTVKGDVDAMVVNEMLQKSWSPEICSLRTYDNLIKYGGPVAEIFFFYM